MTFWSIQCTQKVWRLSKNVPPTHSELIQFFVVNFSALNLSYNDHGKKITISLIGLVLRERSTQTNSSDVDENSLTVNVRNKNKSNNSVAKVYDFIFDDYEENTVTFDFYPDVSSSSSSSPAQALNLTFTMSAVGMTDNPPISLHLLVNPNAIVPEIGVLAAAIILIFFNVLLGAEVIVFLELHSCTLSLSD